MTGHNRGRGVAQWGRFTQHHGNPREAHAKHTWRRPHRLTTRGGDEWGSGQPHYLGIGKPHPYVLAGGKAVQKCVLLRVVDA